MELPDGLEQLVRSNVELVLPDGASIVVCDESDLFLVSPSFGNMAWRFEEGRREYIVVFSHLFSSGKQIINIARDGSRGPVTYMLSPCHNGKGIEVPYADYIARRKELLQPA